ncbi:hypothetical protein AVEN_271365-1 [Araneus ventricosus]|uniref:Reverse transcriptase RNase H-like domain-containing protein n=1 Tax=Araneus ventricosus TaxID=182803 RepID=A0A4Y2LTX5_ARAVE|nr:hypothetical protein AVEN_271365-1 [Araneus ventricosus]
MEKEALPVVWGCAKFQEYIVGLTVNIETDHKALVPIFLHKALDALSSRLQRMKLKMMIYSYQVLYIPGKDLVIADALSRSPIEERQEKELTRNWLQSIFKWLLPLVQQLIKDCQKFAKLSKRMKFAFS